MWRVIGKRSSRAVISAAGVAINVEFIKFLRVCAAFEPNRPSGAPI
jgi:hypothetical protein